MLVAACRQPTVNSQEISDLSNAQSGMTVTAWIAAIDNTTAAVNTVHSMQNNMQQNPFSLLISNITYLNTTSQTLTRSQIPALSSQLAKYNGLYYNNASIAFDDILARMSNINDTVIELPSDADKAHGQVLSMSRGMKALYASSPSPRTLPGTLNNLASQLAMPDAAVLSTKAATAQSQLNNAGDTAPVLTYLADLKSALNSLVTPVMNVGDALDNYKASPTPTNWNTLKVRCNQLDGGMT